MRSQGCEAASLGFRVEARIERQRKEPLDMVFSLYISTLYCLYGIERMDASDDWIIFRYTTSDYLLRVEVAC
jgi:hypothetical protein